MNKPTCLSMLLTLALAACGGGGGDDAVSPPPPGVAEPATQDVDIRFSAVAGPSNTAVACGEQINGLGAVSTSAQLTDLRFYLTNVQLVDDKGRTVPVALTPNEWQFTSGTDSVTLIDLEDGKGRCAAEGTATVNDALKGKVPAGNYVQIRATIGVPERLSHSDVAGAPAPLNVVALAQSRQAGRKFAKIELDPVGGVITSAGANAGIVSTYALRLASTDCTGNNDGNDTCAKKNLAQFSFNLNPATQRIAVDMAELFNTTNIQINQGGAVGCLSDIADPDCPALFTKLGLDLLTGERSATAQTVFRPILK